MNDPSSGEKKHPFTCNSKLLLLNERRAIDLELQLRITSNMNEWVIRDVYIMMFHELNYIITCWNRRRLEHSAHVALHDCLRRITRNSDLERLQNQYRCLQCDS